LTACGLCGLVAVPFVTQLLLEHRDLNVESSNEFLSIEAIGCSVCPTRLTVRLNRLDEDKCLDRCLARFQWVHRQTTECFRDQDPDLVIASGT